MSCMSPKPAPVACAGTCSLLSQNCSARESGTDSGPSPPGQNKISRPMSRPGSRHPLLCSSRLCQGQSVRACCGCCAAVCRKSSLPCSRAACICMPAGQDCSGEASAGRIRYSSFTHPTPSESCPGNPGCAGQSCPSWKHAWPKGPMPISWSGRMNAGRPG